MIAGKLEKDHSLVNETERHWEQIWDQRHVNRQCIYASLKQPQPLNLTDFVVSFSHVSRYLFDARKLEAAELRDIKKADVTNWYSKFLSPSSPSRRKLMVHIWGCNTDPTAMNSAAGDGTVLIEDINAFKKGSKYFDPLD